MAGIGNVMSAPSTAWEDLRNLMAVVGKPTDVIDQLEKLAADARKAQADAAAAQEKVMAADQKLAERAAVLAAREDKLAAAEADYKDRINKLRALAA